MPYFKHTPFNPQVFREYAQNTGPIVQKAEEDARGVHTGSDRLHGEQPNLLGCCLCLTPVITQGPSARGGLMRLGLSLLVTAQNKTTGSKKRKFQVEFDAVIIQVCAYTIRFL